MSNKIFIPIERARKIITDQTKFSPIEVESLIGDLIEQSDGMPKWLVIVIKGIIYVLGLLLAGVGTATAATLIF